MMSIYVLWPFLPYTLGILTYHYYLKLRQEMNRGNGGGEIHRIVKLKRN